MRGELVVGSSSSSDVSNDGYDCCDSLQACRPELQPSCENDKHNRSLIKVQESYYLLLCFVHDMTKYVHSKSDITEKRHHLMALVEIMKGLIKLHFNNGFGTKDSFMIEKKVLCIVCTFLNFRARNTIEENRDIYSYVAYELTLALECSDISWDFPQERTFLGGNITGKQHIDEGENSFLMLLIEAVFQSSAIMILNNYGKFFCPN